MQDDEIIKEFLIESYENLDRLDQDLIVLEKDPANRETLASVFRTIHTIKGTSGFLAFNQLEALAHAGENLLARLRDGLLKLTPEITTGLLATVDAVRQMLRSVEESGTEGVRDDKALIATLTQLLEGKPVSPGAIPAPAPSENKVEVYEEAEPADQGTAPEAQPDLIAESKRSSHEDQTGKSAPQPSSRGPSAGDSTIRVDVGQLDRLMNRVGELVLLRNQIVQYTNASEESPLAGPGQRLNLLTTELQESVMKTRMQPIGNIWSKFPRTVRDVAVSCGKEVRVVMEGQETELDKTIIEAIKDPLTHLVRNAVDHGIETPAARQAAGKPPVGLLCLRAFHEGGQVNIEITDDGAGMNLERIRSKAIQKNLITAEHAARLSDREVANLIFMPGLSTAEKITNVSGRGVGMDVVKTNIEKIGGKIDLQSKTGQGSTVRMKIPLTLAIIPALIVASAGERYAIPQLNLVELVRLEGEQARTGIEFVNGSPVYRMRGRLLPIVYLSRQLQTQAQEKDPASGRASNPALPNSGGDIEDDDEKGIEDDVINIVVLNADERFFGLVIDEIIDTEEIVVKPLSKQLKSVHVYAGATIMGDGNVALILDVLGLAQHARVVGESPHRGVGAGGDDPAEAGNGAQRGAVLLFQYGEHRRMAVDLSMVARLEEFSRNSIEVSSNREVVQYRGEIMPLLRVSDALDGARSDASDGESLQVVVYARQGRNVGLVVDRILDIVEGEYVWQTQAARKGVLGSALIQQRVTDILDLPALVATVDGGQFAASF
jgi:two-component system chemotaxis sensor kinase CheA